MSSRDAHAVSERFDLPARLGNVLEEPRSKVSDNNVVGESAEESDKVWYAIVARWKTSCAVPPDQPVRSHETAVCNDEVESFDQRMKAGFYTDKIRRIQEATAPAFH